MPKEFEEDEDMKAVRRATREVVARWLQGARRGVDNAAPESPAAVTEQNETRGVQKLN